MTMTSSLIIALSFTLGGQMASARDLSRYRTYDLESSMETVVAASGARQADAKTLHDRPATIQHLQWRAPYLSSPGTPSDPVREIAFTFYNDALYRIVVTYDRNRTAGLTPADIVESLSATYGTPALPPTAPQTSLPAETPPDGMVLARWETDEALLTFARESATADFQLILTSKSLNALAQSAIREAVRLDGIDAPRLASERREQEADDASAARDKMRLTNKAAFRP